MPPKINTRKKVQDKVKRQKKNNHITKRLMEISIKVDKYIYKNRPISVAEARLYIQEVNSYQPQCRNDERSIQVIEKLTRNMQAIIEEQATTAAVTHQEDTDKTYFYTSCGLSPVYSLPDEDRALLTQYITDDNINTVNEDNVYIDQTPPPNQKNSVSFNTIYNKTERSQTLAEINYNCNGKELNSIDVIDLCLESEDRDNIQTKDINVKMSKVINDLTLDEVLEEPEPCSQSIFGNLINSEITIKGVPPKEQVVYKQKIAPNYMQRYRLPEKSYDPFNNKPPISSLNTYQHLSNTVNTKTKTLEYNTRSNNVDGKVNEVMNDTNLNETEPCSQSILKYLPDPGTAATIEQSYKHKKDFKILNLAQGCQIQGKAKDGHRRNNKPLKKCTENTKRFNETSKLIVYDNKKENKKPLNRKTKTVATHSDLIPNHSERKGRNNKSKDKILNRNKNIEAVEKPRKVQNNKATVKSSKTYHTLNNCESVNPITISKTNYPSQEQSKASQNGLDLSCISKMPEKHVQEDILWIENIKFIREICLDEYDDKYNNLCDSFWENCHLPECWDDKDFD